MSFEWVVPAGYGLDRGGWVTCIAPDDTPLEMITGWIEESYRIVGPKTLAALIGIGWLGLLAWRRHRGDCRIAVFTPGVCRMAVEGPQGFGGANLTDAM